MIRIAHLSDLHFSNWDWRLSQFFSKRWLGNFNYLFGRRRIFVHDQLLSLPALFKEKGVTHVVISGDLTTTSSPAEFERAKAYVEGFGVEVFCIPGNHDQYTKQELFYDYFPKRFDEKSPYNLKDHKITTKALSKEWDLVALDTAIATPYFYSTGLFSEKAEKYLTEYLETSNKKVVLVNHFPFFQHESFRKRLVRGDALRKLLEKFPQVKIYCHGHTHRMCVADLRASQLPIILDSGCVVDRNKGSWQLLDLHDDRLTTEHYLWKNGAWISSNKESYELV